MIKLRNRKNRRAPDLQISPMIDMMFTVLLFFIFSTMYMTEVKTVPVKLPTAENSVTQSRTSFVVAVKENGSIWLGEQPTNIDALAAQAANELKHNKDLAIIIRADKKANYGLVINVLDKLKGAGVNRFGMATDYGSTK